MSVLSYKRSGEILITPRFLGEFKEDMKMQNQPVTHGEGVTHGNAHSKLIEAYSDLGKAESQYLEQKDPSLLAKALDDISGKVGEVAHYFEEYCWHHERYVNNLQRIQSSYLVS